MPLLRAHMFVTGTPALGADGKDGAVTLPVGTRKTLHRACPSSRSGHCSPCPHSFAAKLAKCLTADQVTLNVEGVVDGGVC